MPDWAWLLTIAGGLVALLWILARKAVPEPPPPPSPPPSPPPPQGLQRISIVVRSAAYPADEVKAYVVAQQAQVSGEFAPFFGIDAVITLEPQSPSSWPVFLDDASDQPGALGYHTVDAGGTPYARVFLNESKAAGVAWQSVASHEVVEMLADPSTTKTALGPNGRPWAYETGDPVEDVEYNINGVPMSDFVTPAWFIPGIGPTGTVIDDQHKLIRSYQITNGGYAQYQDTNGNWIQVSGPSARKARK